VDALALGPQLLHGPACAGVGGPGLTAGGGRWTIVPSEHDGLRVHEPDFHRNADIHRSSSLERAYPIQRDRQEDFRYFFKDSSRAFLAASISAIRSSDRFLIRPYFTAWDMASSKDIPRGRQRLHGQQLGIVCWLSYVFVGVTDPGIQLPGLSVLCGCSARRVSEFHVLTCSAP